MVSCKDATVALLDIRTSYGCGFVCWVNLRNDILGVIKDVGFVKTKKDRLGYPETVFGLLLFGYLGLK